MPFSPLTPPEKARLRRLGAIVVLVVGALVTTRLLRDSWPREHWLVFRLPREATQSPFTLEASFTQVGETEPARGLTLALPKATSRDVRQRLNLPNGDYIVALEITYGDNPGPMAPAKSETSRPRRVTLDDNETLVVFEAEGPE